MMSASMRISVDAMPLLVRSAGVKNYLYHWITHLRRAAPEARIELFPWLGHLDRLDHERSQVGRLRTVWSLGWFHFFNLPGNPAVNWVEHADIFHCAKLLNPPRRPKLTATIHDLTCWTMPQFHTPANVRWEQSYAERVWKRADGLIAVSEHSRQEAVRLLGIAPERIRVIHSGVDERFFRVTAAETEAVRKKYGLAQPYILSVGPIEPRKNLDMALEVYGGLKASLREEFAFVVAGPEGWAARETAARMRRGEKGAQYLGYVDEADLPGLTAGAAVLFYPSLHEGFGFPVAQAMACGVSVLTSNVSALPEVAGEGAVLADPRSESELRAGLERLLLGPGLREKIAREGRKRAQQYRWEETARQSMEFFRSL
jgi:glycosyltransferase involved in cell wall biosynthesis